jgi:hypothetical protein
MIVESPLDLVCRDFDLAVGKFILETATSSHVASALSGFFSSPPVGEGGTAAERPSGV